MSSLYGRLGGEAAVDAAVDGFYVKVLADPLLAPFFTNTNMDSQKNKQKMFLTLAFGGPQKYTGVGMRAAHKKSVAAGLEDQHFDAVVGHLADTLQELGVAPELIGEVAEVAETVRGDVLNKDTTPA